MNFLSKNWRALVILTLGVATVLVGAFVLQNCADAGHFVKGSNGMDMHMACTWTKRAVLGLGGLTAVTGLVMLAYPTAANALSMVSLAIGALMIATPLWLIPTCKNAMMTCNMSLKPGTLIFGGLILLAGVAGALRFARADRSRMAA